MINLIIKLSFLMIVNSCSLFATTELATFESFYVESTSIGWIFVAIAAAIAGVVAWFVTVGTATPVVLGIGTWIGNMAGLSGIAATNYGLALIGGGSIATGGLGMAGGVTILTLALTFSTEVVIDYSVTNVVNSYSYSKFVENSKNLATLPIPQNKDGSDEHERIIENLKNKINIEKETLFSNENQKILSEELKNNKLKNNDIKDLALLSYLYFSTTDYLNAKKIAFKSIELAREEKIKRTLPAFIFAISSLYDEKFNFENLTKNYFRYSILAEPENKLIPLMVSMYLDRILYRMNDNLDLNSKTMDSIKEIALEIKDEDLKNQSLVVIMMRYIIKIKLEQQKILSLSKSENIKIKNDKKTLEIVKQSLKEYINLVNSLKTILDLKSIQDYISKEEELKNLNILHIKYESEINYLNLRIENLEKEQLKQ